VVNQIPRVLVAVGKSEEWDKAWWMLTSNGKFTIKSAWEALRRRSSDQEEMKFIWQKGIPFKISFFMWRL